MKDLLPNLEKFTDDSVNALLKLGLTHMSSVVDEDMVETIRSFLAASGQEGYDILYKDLNIPLSSSHEGPLSFNRLSGIKKEALENVRGMTFLEVLKSPAAEQETLECLAEYGELLTMPLFPESTQLTGAVVHLLALTALGERHGVAIEMSDTKSTSVLLETISTAQGVSDDLRDSASHSTQVLGKPPNE